MIGVAQLQLVVFQLNGQEFGIDVRSIGGILRAKKLKKSRVPSMPSYVDGIADLRGKIAYIINLRKRFGMENRLVDDNTKIIMIDINRETVGFMVDEVTDILTLSTENIVKTPDFLTEIDVKQIKGIGKVADRIIILLDAFAVMTADAEVPVKLTGRTVQNYPDCRNNK